MGYLRIGLDVVEQSIRQKLAEIQSPYNDGWTASGCKRDLYHLKCWLNEEYAKLPTFVGEEKWEQERVFELLKKE